MTNSPLRIATLVLAVLLVIVGLAERVAAAADSADEVVVGGAVASPGRWTGARIRQQLAGDVRQISYAVKGTTHRAAAVPLRVLVQASRPALDARRHHPELGMVVVIRARDGYAIAVSFGEMLPDIGNREVWLALDEDGQPLGPSVGPMRLIVPGDGRPSRWIRQIAAITVVDTTRP
jgi:hypothetical protein